MDLTFLSGAIPLTKTITYSVRDDHYTTTPYPLIQRVSSTIVADVRSMTGFATALREQGKLGACLLKGSLDQPLVRESRAGHAMDLEHEWIVFDFDKVDCAPTFDGALAAIGKYLPKGCANTSCVIQLSASTVRPDCRKLSAHIFMRLSTPASTRLLTDWLTYINFSSALKDEMELTESAIALRYPLDRSVTSSAKLIYIAPPRCIGFEPPGTDLVRSFSGRSQDLKIPAFTPIGSDEQTALINALRRNANMKEREIKTRTVKDIEYLIDAESCVVSDIKPSGDGYIRFNLNGGDSQSYFINLREPGVIGNFKSEPYMMTAQAAPDLFKALSKSSQTTPAKLPPSSIEPLAFYATNRQSMIYIGTYDREHDKLRIEPSTQTAAYSWLAQFGVPIKQALPHYDVTYDMTSPIRFEEGYPIINLYEQTAYLKQFSDEPKKTACEILSLDGLKVQAPTLWRVMYSALGCNVEAALYFINWLAAVFQRKQRTQSAWVLHGTQGTGKGLIVNHILRPLFGIDTVTQQLYALLNTNFNAYMEGKLFVVFDEADLSRTVDQVGIRSKLYDWISEPIISVNGKGVNERDVPNTANILLLSNSQRPIMIEQGDRRFNVGEKQTDRLYMGPNELAILVDQRELPALAKTLGSWQINDQMLVKPYGGEAKKIIYESTHSLLDRVGRAINEGDTDFFVENRPDPEQLRTDFGGKMLPMREYDALLTRMVDRDLPVLTASDLYVLFRMICISDKLFSENKASQRQIYQRYGLLDGKAMSDPRTKKTVRGVRLTKPWVTSNDLREQVKGFGGYDSDKLGNVLPIGKRSKK